MCFILLFLNYKNIKIKINIQNELKTNGHLNLSQFRHLFI